MKRLFFALFSLILTVGCGKTSDEAANKLFVEATKLISQAQMKEGSDIKAAVADYVKALENIRKIVDEYPESDLAVKLASNETLFTGKSMEKIKGHVEELKIRADENRYDIEIQRYADHHGVAPALIKAVIWRESRFNPDARGTSADLGLMQIRAALAGEWAEAAGISDFHHAHLLNSTSNILCGAWYLHKLIDRYQHTDDPVAYALADYNAGRSNVLKWNNDAAETNSAAFIENIDFPTTKNYLHSVLQKQSMYQKMFEQNPRK